MCVISGVVSSSPAAISRRISAQSQPSTPPVLKVRFLPYISGRGSTCGLSYSATMVTIAFGRAHSHAMRKLSSVPATSSTTSAPPWALFCRTNSSTCPGDTVSTSG